MLARMRGPLPAIASALPLLLGSTALAQCANDWAPLGGLNNGVRTLCIAKNGDVLAGGDFTTAGGAQALRVARHDGVSWQPMGGGLPWAVHALAELSDGSIVGGGMFGGIWRWNGTAWSMLGSLQPFTWDICALPNGGCAIAGSFPAPGGNHAAIWDGTTWSAVGGGLNGDGLAVARKPTGELVYGGTFTRAGTTTCNFVAQWNGSTWSTFGTGLNDLVIAVCALRDGSIVVGGNFTQAGGQPAAHIARWTGSAWQPLGAGVNSSVLCITEMPDGDLLVGGDFTSAGGQPAANIARWDGNAWHAIGAGTSQLVWDITQPARDAAIVGGVFSSAGGIASANIAKLTSSCSATALSTNGACGGASIVAERHAWLGGALQTRCSGLLPNSLCFAVTGFGLVGTPLASLLPYAPSGCVLQPSLDLVDFTFASDGSSRFHLAVPNDPFLNSLPLWRQDIGITIDGNGHASGLQASNGLACTLGSF